jgi:hypothetical protein
MSQQTNNCTIAVIGIDIGKNSFHIAGRDGPQVGTKEAADSCAPGQPRRMAATGQDSALLAGLPAMPDW